MKRLLSILSVLVLLVFFSGCWNNVDITEMSISTGVGIDKEDGKYLVSAQIINTSSKGNGSGQSSGGGSEKKSGTTVVCGYGDTIFDAVRNLLHTTNKKVYFGHCRILVISKEVASEGLSHIIDFFERDSEFKYRMQILVSKDISAKDVLSAKSVNENISALYVEGILRNEKNIGKVKQTSLLESAQMVELYGKHLVTSIIQPKIQKEKYDMEDLKVDNAAIFDKGILKGYMGPKELRGFLFTQDKITSTIIVTEKHPDGMKRTSLEVKDAKAKIDVQQTDAGRFIYLVNVNVRANIGSRDSTPEISVEDATVQVDLPELEKEASEIIKSEIQQTFDISKDLESDIFGFGEIIHRKYPDVWKKVKYNWDLVYANNDIAIDVKTKIENTGLTKGTIRSK